MGHFRERVQVACSENWAEQYDGAGLEKLIMYREAEMEKGMIFFDDASFSVDAGSLKKAAQPSARS